LSRITAWKKQAKSYSVAIDGDSREKVAWSLFIQSEFPSYDCFWLKHVVPLTKRPASIHLKDDATLAREGKTAEDVAIAQLHYTVLKHLLGAQKAKQAQTVDEFTLFIGLSCLTGAQDVAFELLQRYTNRGKYDPWTESRAPKGRLSGHDAQDNWKKTNNYPLQDVRDYRNKLIHGRTPPAIVDPAGVRLPAIHAVDKYCDWRLVTDPAKATSVPPGDFEYASLILATAWDQTIQYLEAAWQKHLLQ